MIRPRPLSDVNYASGLFFMEYFEPDGRTTYRLGVYVFPENKLQEKLRQIDRSYPLSNALEKATGSTIGWSNPNLGYTVSVSLSGFLKPIRQIKDDDDSAFNVFAFVYRAFVQLNENTIRAYGRLLDIAWWLRTTGFG